MTIVFAIFLALFSTATASDLNPRTSRDHDRSRSREVDNYLRSMSKIKPQWAEDKILRSARAIYGEDSVPLSTPHYQPGTAPVRPGSVAYKVEGGMSLDKKKQEVYRLRLENPTWKSRDIADQFVRDYPSEPNPPHSELVQRYLFFKAVDERVASLPDGNNWNFQAPGEKAAMNEIGKGIMKRNYSANPDETWEELVFATISEVRRDYGFRLAASTVYNWYLEVRKEALGHGSKRGPRKSRNSARQE